LSINHCGVNDSVVDICTALSIQFQDDQLQPNHLNVEVQTY